MRTLKCAALLILAVLFCHFAAKGQIVLKGTVMTDTGEPAAFSTVILRPVNDTTNLADAAVADTNGNYSFRKQPEGQYLLWVQLIGYETLNDTVVLRQASEGLVVNEAVRNYTLITSSNEIDEIVVRASTVNQQLDKTVYTITKDDRKLALTGLDLMKKVPQLTVDPVSQKLKTGQGGITVFIDGANSSEQELKTLLPENIKNIEYYELPPAKYGTSGGKVINVVTKGNKDGFWGGVDLQHAFTTGFFNDSFYLKYNRGKSQFSLDYYGSYRNYNDVNIATEYDYNLNGVDYVRRQNSTRPFGYMTNEINIKYTNQVQDKYIFHANIYPNFTFQNSTVNSDIELIAGNDVSKRYGKQDTKSKEFNPVVDIYFWKKLRPGEELTVNILGTYFNVYQDYSNNEYVHPSTPLLTDYQKIHNLKYSAIGQAIYSKEFKKVTLSFGDKFSYELLDSKIANSFLDSRYKTNLLSNYLFGELSGHLLKRKLQYRASVGVNTRYAASEQTRTLDWVFSPNILVGYQFSETCMLRAGFSQYNTSPSLGQLNNSISFISDNIIQRNNPYLKNGFSNYSFLGLAYNKNWLSLYVDGFFRYAKNPVNSYFVEGEQYMELVQENARFGRSYGMKYSIQISPFKNRLFTLKLEGGAFYQQYDSPFSGLSDYFTVPFSYEINFNYKNFSAFYQGNIEAYYLQAPYLSSNENMSNLGVAYRYKNFLFSATCIGFLTDLKYKTKTVRGSAVTYNSRQNIADNKNMIIFGISYQFGRGSEYKETQRRISNSDKDSGI